MLVTITAVRGSAPRAVGSHMLITGQRQWGSIGGGNLEFQSTDLARKLLSESDHDLAREQRFGLGPALNQCCGGSVTVLFEVLRAQHYPWLDECTGPEADKQLLTVVDGERSDKSLITHANDGLENLPPGLREQVAQQPVDTTFVTAASDGRRFIVESLQRRRVRLALFGAGHVARVLVPLLREQPFELHWVDSRPDAFPEHSEDCATLHRTVDPVSVVGDMPPGTAFLVMTHSHELDEDICDAVLGRNDHNWLGLIGSETKRRRFEHRLAARGHGEASLSRLVCPVGLAGIPGKRPATIAVTILAQLLRDCVPEHWR